MLLPGRVEGWPAGTQRAANAAERLLSQAVAWWDVGQYRDGDRFLRNRGTGAELLDLRLGSALAPNSNDPLFLPVDDRGYVYLPGVASNFLSVPDEAALDITGDIDIRAQVALDDWTPSATQLILSKLNNTGDQRSYTVNIRTTGVVRLSWSTDGAGTVNADSTVAPTVADGAALWVRATLDVDNGASGYDVKFFTSSDGVTWTQLGTTVTGVGVTSIFASTTAVRLGQDFGSTVMAGKFYRAQVLNGIDGTTVLDIDCDAITSGSATTFTALTGQTVTINRSTSGRKSVAVPDRANRGASVMLLGADDYLEVQDNWQHGLLNFRQGDSFTVVAVIRQWATPITNRAIVGKYDATGIAGYRLRQSATAFATVAEIGSGGSSANDVGTSTSSGTLASYAAVADRSANVITAYANGTPSGSPTNIAAIGSLVTTQPLYVGRADTAIFTETEFYAAAIFRRALSPAEITALSNYFTGRIA
jgi:hypothetical protein